MRLILIPWMLLSLNAAIGQTPVQDSIIYRSAITRAINRYHEFMGTGALVYNGGAYTGFNPSILGHLFFMTDSLEEGSVLYDGVWYQHVPMLYDIFSDQLVIRNPDKSYICPSPDKIGQFLFLGHSFIQTPKGYYDVLCSGALVIEAKRYKEIQQRSTMQDLAHQAVENDRFYLVKGDVYQRLLNVRSLLALLGDKRSLVRTYLRKNKISLRKDKELAIVKAAEYYNQLSR